MNSINQSICCLLEAADKLVGEASAGGHGNPVITAEGIRAWSKGKIRRHQAREGFGDNRHRWGNQALAAYTLLRTNKGPQLSWLKKTDSAPNADYPGCGVEETGEHVGFPLPGAPGGEAEVGRHSGVGRGRTDMMR